MTPDELFAGRKQVLQNATDLVDDAELLFAAGRHARALFLSQIATEELGKYALIVSSAISAVHGSLSWGEFCRDFRSHNTKTRKLLSLENFHHVLNRRGDHILLSEEDKHYAAIQDKVKMLSLYCDFDDQGFTVPRGQIPGNVADVALELVKSRLRMVVLFEEQVASVYPFESLTKERIDRFRRKLLDLDDGPEDHRP